MTRNIWSLALSLVETIVYFEGEKGRCYWVNLRDDFLQALNATRDKEGGALLRMRTYSLMPSDQQPHPLVTQNGA